MLFERLQNSRSNTELLQGCDFSLNWRAETITKAGHVVFCSRFRINLWRVQFLKKLLSCVDGEVTHNFLLPNKLIKTRKFQSRFRALALRKREWEKPYSAYSIHFATRLWCTSLCWQEWDWLYGWETVTSLPGIEDPWVAQQVSATVLSAVSFSSAVWASSAGSALEEEVAPRGSLWSWWALWNGGGYETNQPDEAFLMHPPTIGWQRRTVKETNLCR